MTEYVVGEVAIIIVDDWAPKFPMGSEVTIGAIAGPPGDPQEYCIDIVRVIPYQGLELVIRCCTAGKNLRKRRLPPDWNKLCELDSIKTDEPAEA